jgi:hypothetical protein
MSTASQQLTALGLTHSLLKHAAAANLSDYIKLLAKDEIVALKTVFLSTSHIVITNAQTQYSVGHLPSHLGVKKVRIGICP